MALNREFAGRRYRRFLALATVSPLLVAMVAFRLDIDGIWPWVVVLPVVIATWVAHDAWRRGAWFPLWAALATLPAGLWLLFLARWLDHR